MKKSPAESSVTPPKTSASRMRYLWLINVVFLAIVIVIALHWGDWRTFLKLIKQIKPVWLLLAVLLQIGTYICVTIIWATVLETSKIYISPLHLFALSIAKLFSDQTVPSFGISGSIVAMKGLIRRKSSSGAAAAAVIINTTSRYLPYFLLFLVAIGILWKDHMLNKGLQYLAVIFSVAVACLLLVVSAMIRMTSTHHTPRWAHKIKWFDGLLKTIRKIPSHVFKKRRLWLVASVANGFIFLLDTSTMWALLSSLGHSTGLWPQAYASIMISSVVTDLAIVPGRIGVFEGSTIALLHLFKIPIENAVAATVLFRGFTYWLPMLPGFVITRHELQKS